MAMNMSAVLQISAAVTGAQAIDDLNRKVGALHGTSRHAESGFSAFAAGVKNFVQISIVEMLRDFATESINTANMLELMAQKTGIAVEELGKFKEAGDITGVSLDDIGGGLKKLSINMLSAANGNKEFSALFKALGVSVRDASGNIRSSGDVMLDVADVFSKLDDGAVKSAAAVKLFGKAGDTLIPFLDQGKEKLNEFHSMISDQYARDAHEFKVQIDDIGDSFEGMGNRIMGTVLPALNAFLEKIGQILKSLENGNFLKALVMGGGGGKIALGGASEFLNDLQVTVSSKGSSPTAGTTPGSATSAMNQRVGAIAAALGSGGGGDKLKEFLASEQQALDMLKAESMQLDMTTAEYKAYLDQVKFDVELKKLAAQAGVELTDDFKRRVQAIEDEKKQLIMLNEEYKRSFFGGLKAGLKEVQEMATDVGGAVRQTLTDAFKGAEDAFVKFVQTGKLDFKSLINSIIADLARVAFRGMFSSLFNGGGGGGLFSGLFSGPFGRNALGTDNWQGGMTWVGESGPELVNLPKGAQVIPNHKLEQSGSGNVTQNVTLNFAPGVSPQDLQQVIPHITEAASNLALRKINRGAMKARA